MSTYKIYEHTNRKWSFCNVYMCVRIKKSLFWPLKHIFLVVKTCCAFDCTPNVDAEIEDKIKDRQKATLQAMHVIHACRKETLFFLQTNWTMS